jgi:primosomal protein N' (replication factor Y) (superfamily II helicase)
MYYYEVALLGLRLGALTYECAERIDLGCLVKVSVRGKQAYAVVIKEAPKPEFKCVQILEKSSKRLSADQITVGDFIAKYYVCELGIALALFEPFDDAMPYTESFETPKEPHVLSQKQLKAYEFCKSQDTSLIFGDTGSGKTEIYIKLIIDTLESGKSAIFLLPEIALTPQIQKRLKKVFGSAVAVWHSKQSKKNKEETLKNILNGTIRVIAGPRSSLFLPLTHLGLIIVDEEHDDSFKSQSSPRYNARDLSIYIGRKIGAKVVLGSATPSLASYKNIPFTRLKGGHFEASKKFVFSPKSAELDDDMVRTIEKTLSNESSQAIVFLPTRANFKYIVCNDCHKSIECPYCSVAMSLHASERLLKCHYCGFSEYMPPSCPSCKTGMLGFHRLGTTEVYEELSARMKGKIFAKFDRDEITTETKLKKTLDAFNKGEIDVLIGTQMLSKGHDYHGVDLAVILGLDSILAQSDFRARERAMSLLVQISGRAGRKRSAKVYVQTLNGEFFSSYLDDYERFLKDELQTRKLYPPFTKLARLTISDTNAERAKQKTMTKANELKNAAVEIVGYGEAKIAKIGGKYRFDILLRHGDSKALLQAIYSVLDDSFEVDMDPLSFT